MIVLATANRGKIAEMAELLAGVDAGIRSIADFDDPPVIEEDRPDLAGNALKKAQAWYEHTEMIAVADDTGLEVPFLGGAPGVYSARYGGVDGDADRNIAKLLREMRLATGDEREAQFRTVVAVVWAGGQRLFEGICRGRILAHRQGSGGFGYDPVFVPEGFDVTFAELSKSEKNAVSHRGMAVRAAAEFLRSMRGSD